MTFSLIAKIAANIFSPSQDKLIKETQIPNSLLYQLVYKIHKSRSVTYCWGKGNVEKQTYLGRDHAWNALQSPAQPEQG